MGRWPVPRWWAVGAVSVRLALLVVWLMLVFLLVFLLAEVRRLVRPAAASLVRHARVIDFRCTETVFEPDFRCSIPLHFYVAEYVAFDILCNASFVALFRCAALLPGVRSGFG